MSLAIVASIGHIGVASIHAAMSTSPADEGEQASAGSEDEDEDDPIPMLRLLDPLAPASEGLQVAIVFVNTD